MIPRRDRGLALILVMTVVMALAIIATPFVVSMILQERSGTTARHFSQADYGADGAKNYAVWRLMQSLDPIERRSGTGLFSSYTYDTEAEFEVRLDDAALSRVNISDAKGSIWGLAVQDEQGKLNARSCNPRALQTLSELVDSRVVNLKDYITLYSGRDATWVCPQRIRPVGFQTGNPAGGVTVDNLYLLAPKSRVRLTKAGQRPVETRISGNALLGNSGQDGFTTEAGAGGFIDGVIEVEARHPVNLNTARRETLVAMFEGLQLWNPKAGAMDPNSLVDRNAASTLATRFAGRETQRLEQFLVNLATTSLRTEQKVAVALNAVCPNFALLNNTGTVPLCFKSYDVYTLEAFASMNSPAGTEVAGRGYREVVSVSPPTTLRRYCESQYDFNQMMSQLVVAMQAVQPKYAFGGYPYGNRMLSYPKPYTQVCDTALKPQSAPNEAFVTVTPSQDERGELPDKRYETDLAGWTDPHNRNHYTTELDGKKTSGPETFDWRQFFALNHTSEDDQLQPSQQRPDTGSGGFEIWTRYDSDPGNATIFDIKEQDTTNRVTLRMENKELILTAADTTIPNTKDIDGHIANGVAEIHWPNFKISPDTWTHFSAHWKSNRYADLALFVDGFSDPQAKFMHYTAPGGRELMTKLTSALTPTSTTLSLKNDSFLPGTGELTPIQIGSEVILYDKKSGTVVRGMRGTTATDHQSQVTVSLFGYSSKVRQGQISIDHGNGFIVTLPYDRIPMTNATSTYNFGSNPIATVAGDKQDPITMMWQIDNAQTQIGVMSGAITEFPDQGYIKIDDEIIYYTGRSTGGLGGTPPGNAKFTGCLRGQFTTTPVAHRSGAQVELWSVAVSNLANYPPRVPSDTTGTIIQIGDEWIGPVRQDPSGKNFWIGFVRPGGKPLQLRRAIMGSIPSNHSAADKIIPTFLGQDVNNWPARGHSMGAGDRVTIVDGPTSNTKITARIQRAGPFQQPGNPPQWPGNWTPQNCTQIAALTDFVTRDWVADDLYVRILKFPSGELLSRSWLESNAAPQVTIGPVGGQIDELKAFAATKGRVRLAQYADLSVNTFIVNPVGFPFSQNGGLIKFGDEYVGYGKWTQNQTQGTIDQLQRGWLNSDKEIHDLGDSGFYLPWIPVSSLASDIGTDDNVIHLSQHLSGDPQKYTKGYVLVDNEMILFEWNGGNGQTLSMPPRWDGQKGLYRGMFGTQPTSHAAGTSLVYGMPFRTWDTFKDREFDNSMVYFQWGTKMDLAHWKTFRWVQEVPAKDTNIVVHALARIDGRGEFWDSPGLNDNVLLISSITAGSDVKVDRTGYLQDAGQFDVRFYVEYKQGSFDAQNPRNAESWKRCPKIKEIQVEYDRPTQTLHHEDR